MSARFAISVCFHDHHPARAVSLIGRAASKWDSTALHNRAGDEDDDFIMLGSTLMSPRSSRYLPGERGARFEAEGNDETRDWIVGRRVSDA